MPLGKDEMAALSSCHYGPCIVTKKMIESMARETPPTLRPLSPTSKVRGMCSQRCFWAKALAFQAQSAGNSYYFLEFQVLPGSLI